MSGYTIMFILIVVFLPWFQTEEIHEPWHPQRLLGYYATFGLLFGLGSVIIGRVRKSNAKFRFSHVSDWLFIIMLLPDCVDRYHGAFFQDRRHASCHLLFVRGPPGRPGAHDHDRSPFLKMVTPGIPALCHLFCKPEKGSTRDIRPKSKSY